MIDDKDRKILELLREDSRRSFTEIADKLNVSEATVRNRVNSMEDEGVIQKFTVELDPSEIGYDTVALVGLDIEPERLLEGSKTISGYDKVKFVATSAGDHMIMFKIWARDNEDLGKFISDEIGEIEGVKDICPAILLEKIKY